MFDFISGAAEHAASSARGMRPSHPPRRPYQIRADVSYGGGAHRRYAQRRTEVDVYRLPREYEYGIVHDAEAHEGYGLMHRDDSQFAIGRFEDHRRRRRRRRCLVIAWPDPFPRVAAGAALPGDDPSRARRAALLLLRRPPRHLHLRRRTDASDDQRAARMTMVVTLRRRLLREEERRSRR